MTEGSGIAFLTMVAILMAPLLHRFLHPFHLEVSEKDLRDQGGEQEAGKP